MLYVTGRYGNWIILHWKVLFSGILFNFDLKISKHCLEHLLHKLFPQEKSVIKVVLYCFRGSKFHYNSNWSLFLWYRLPLSVLRQKSKPFCWHQYLSCAFNMPEVYCCFWLKMNIDTPILNPSESLRPSVLYDQ